MTKKIWHMLGMLLMLPLLPMGIFSTVLAADQDIARKEDVLTQYPVTASEIIYKGALVCVDTDGYLLAAADTAGLKFAGIAYEQKDNSSGLDAALSCRVYTKGVFLLTCTSITQAMVGQLMYVTDDDVVDESATNYICAGRLVKYVSATSGWVDIGDRAAVGEEDIHLSAAKRLYFRDSGVYIYSPQDGRIGIVADGGNYDAISLQGDVWLNGGDLLISTNKRINIRDTGTYIYSPTDGRLAIVTDGTAYDSLTLTSSVLIHGSLELSTNNRINFWNTSNYIYAVAAGRLAIVTNGGAYDSLTLTSSVLINGALHVTGAVLVATNSALSFTNTNNYIYAPYAGRIAIVTNGGAYDSVTITSDTLFNGNLRVAGLTNKLSFNTATNYIYAPQTGRIAIVVDGTMFDAITLTGNVSINGGFVKLWNTATVGDTEGQIWYDSGSDKIHFWNGTAEQEVTSGGA